MQREETTATGQKQTTLDTIVNQAVEKDLQTHQAALFYGENLAWHLAERPLFKNFCRALLRTSPSSRFDPLTPRQLGDSCRIQEHVLALRKKEDVGMAGKVGFLTFDGGKINGELSRNVYCEVMDGKTAFVNQWAASGEAKDAKYLAKTGFDEAIALRKRGIRVSGACADNARAEQAGLPELKTFYEAEVGELFIVVRCFMHTLNLVFQDVFG